MIKKHQRSASLGQDHQLVSYPQSAGRWISEARFNELPYQGKLMVSAFAGVQEFYKAAQDKFGDKWCWSRGEVPLRQRGQVGTMKAHKMRRDADYPGSLQEFENALQKGLIKEYLLRHLKAADPGNHNALTLLAYQLDHVFAASCDLLCEALAGQPLRPKTVAAAIDLICDPEDLQLSEHFIKGYYHTSGNLLMVQTFVKIFSDMIDLVLARIRPAEDAFSRDDMFKTFYFLGSVLMGHPASEMQDILWRAEDKEKIELKVWRKLEEWKATNPKELKKLDEDAMKVIIEKKREEFYFQVRQSTYGKLAALLGDRSSKLLARLLKGDSRFGTDIPVNKSTVSQAAIASPYKPAKE